MKDSIGFARLISQVTVLRGSGLDTFDIRNIAETVDSFSVNIGADSLDRLLYAMLSGRKIDAIKEYRSMTGIGLKESKDAVEKYWFFKESIAA